jgi:hypothetical protein
MYVVMPSIIKNAAIGSIIVTAAALLFGAGVYETVFCILLFLAYTLLFTSASVFTYRIMGHMTNALLLVFMRVLFVMAAAIPGGVIAIVLNVVSGIEDGVLLMIPVILVNLACSLIFIFLSRRLLVRSELMN